MVSSCCAYGCQNRFSKESLIKFHTFPKDPERRRKWIQAVRRVNFEPTSGSCICSEHFLPSDYRTETHLTRKLLKDNAVPSVFPSFPSHLQPPTKKRRILERVSDVGSEVEIPFHSPDTPLLPISGASGTGASNISNIIQPLDPEKIVQLDHCYAFTSDIEVAKAKCDKLQHNLYEKLAKEHKLRKKVNAEKAKAAKATEKLENILEEFSDGKSISSENCLFLE